MAKKPGTKPAPRAVATVSLRKFAELAGVSPAAIRKAIKTGRIASHRRLPNGDVEIQVKAALAEFMGSANPAKRRRGKADAATDEADIPQEEAEALPSLPLPPENLGDVELSPEENANLNRAFLFYRTKKEKYLAALSELAAKEKSGELVLASEVHAQAFKSCRLVRDTLLNIPDRIAPELVGIDTLFEMHSRLKAEIRSVLVGLAEALPGA